MYHHLFRYSFNIGDTVWRFLIISCAKFEVPFICSTGIFSDRETLELLAVSKTFENLFPCLTSTWFCFVCRVVHLYLFVAIAKVIDRLNNIFFLLRESHTLFHVRNSTHIPQFSSGTVPLDFVCLSHYAFSFFLILQTSLFSFISYITLDVWTATTFCLLF